MQDYDPLNALSAALQSALNCDLPDLVSTWGGKEQRYRPARRNVQVCMFHQEWSTTALGFDADMAGQSFSGAYTTVVMMDRTACVYFAERLAYTVDARNQQFRQDMSSHNLSDQLEAVSKYGAVIPASQFA